MNRKVEPSAWLLPKSGEKKLEYIKCDFSDIRKTWARFGFIPPSVRAEAHRPATKFAAPSTFSIVRGRKA